MDNLSVLIIHYVYGDAPDASNRRKFLQNNVAGHVAWKTLVYMADNNLATFTTGDLSSCVFAENLMLDIDVGYSPNQEYRDFIGARKIFTIILKEAALGITSTVVTSQGNSRTKLHTKHATIVVPDLPHDTPFRNSQLVYAISRSITEVRLTTDPTCHLPHERPVPITDTQRRKVTRPSPVLVPPSIAQPPRTGTPPFLRNLAVEIQDHLSRNTPKHGDLSSPRAKKRQRTDFKTDSSGTISADLAGGIDKDDEFRTATVEWVCESPGATVAAAEREQSEIQAEEARFEEEYQKQKAADLVAQAKHDQEEAAAYEASLEEMRVEEEELVRQRMRVEDNHTVESSSVAVDEISTLVNDTNRLDTTITVDDGSIGESKVKSQQAVHMSIQLEVEKLQKELGQKDLEHAIAVSRLEAEVKVLRQKLGLPV